jgi:hypothetical protein
VVGGGRRVIYLLSDGILFFIVLPGTVASSCITGTILTITPFGTVVCKSISSLFTGTIKVSYVRIL